MKKQTTAPTTTPVVVRMPKKVVTALDKAATKNHRSRSGEVLNRVLQTLASEVRA